MENKRVKVVELFAGVGGFRLGLEKSNYEVVWSNQWEPSTKVQHASMVYEARFGGYNHSNEDIEKVPTDEIPDHDLLTYSFPCQDLSTGGKTRGMKKGSGTRSGLLWEIERILKGLSNEERVHFLVHNSF